MQTIGAYGSLKAGCYNHVRWGLDKCKRLEDKHIRGAMDLFHGSYPRLYAIGDAPAEYERDHILEVYQVDDMTFDRIESMEYGANYYLSTLNGSDPYEDIVVFLMSPSEPFNSENFIESYPPKNI